MIPNNFINNSSYAKKEKIKVKGNYQLFSHLGTPIIKGEINVNK